MSPCYIPVGTVPAMPAVSGDLVVAGPGPAPTLTIPGLQVIYSPITTSPPHHHAIYQWDGAPPAAVAPAFLSPSSSAPPGIPPTTRTASQAHRRWLMLSERSSNLTPRAGSPLVSRGGTPLRAFASFPTSPSRPLPPHRYFPPPPPPHFTSTEPLHVSTAPPSTSLTAAPLVPPPAFGPVIASSFVIPTAAPSRATLPHRTFNPQSGGTCSNVDTESSRQRASSPVSEPARASQRRAVSLPRGSRSTQVPCSHSLLSDDV